MERPIFTVSQINARIKQLFLQNEVLQRVVVRGEVSNCKYHTSGHIYFTIKDFAGQLACVMFAGQRRGLSFSLREGQSVFVYGSIQVYERDGKYQLYANEIHLDGTGLLYEQIEERKRRLAKEGLFAPEKKKKLPEYAARIGVVTAETGAAIQDIVQITRRRNPYVQLILYPALVQGDKAVQSIVRGIRILDEKQLDIIIVGRGGGSVEDLLPFQSEEVARAAAACKTPLISAVGHETDTTILDFVADLRAPTPSAAAELAVFEQKSLDGRLAGFHEALADGLMKKIAQERKRLKEWERLYSYASPRARLKEQRMGLLRAEQRLGNGMQLKLAEEKHRVALYAERLNGVSPLRKLSGGYAYVSDEKGQPLRSVRQLAVNDTVQVTLKDGSFLAAVQAVQE